MFKDGDRVQVVEPGWGYGKQGWVVGNPPISSLLGGVGIDIGQDEPNIIYRLPYALQLLDSEGELIPEPVTLDPSDPFDAALIPIVTTNRKKRADYAKDGDPFSNFRTSAEIFGLEGFEATDSALFNISQKIARLRALRANGRMNETQNESVTDTYLDLAVYGIILFALAKDDSE